MFGKEQFAVPVHRRVEGFQAAAQQILLKELFLDPKGYGHTERAEAPGGHSHIGFQQPLELEKGLVVKDYPVEIGRGQAAGLQAVVDGALGIAGVILLAGKAFLLGGRNDAPVHDQGGGAVVIKGRQAKDTHR